MGVIIQVNKCLGGAVITALIILLCHGNEVREFSEEYVAVYLDPFVSRHDIARYDEYDEAEIFSMVKQVSQRFSRIMMPLTSASDILSIHHSSTNIPTAVVNHNQQRIRCDRFLELIMTFKALEEISDEFQYSAFLDIATHVNSDFPKTVKLFMADFTYAAVTQENLEYAVKQLKEAHAEFSFFDYSKFKLGAIVDKEFCTPKSSSNIPRDLAWILQYVDVIMIDYPASDADVIAGMPSLFPERLSNCISHMKKEFNDIIESNNITLGFRTGWPDASTTGYQNVSNLVFFWELLNDWAEDNNTTIVFNQAFDTPTSLDQRGHTTGWWKLIESSKYTSALDYKFDEKATGGNNLPNPNPHDWLQELYPNGNGPNFNETSFAAGFNPYVINKTLNGSDAVYDKEAIFTLIDKVSQEFSKLLVEIAIDEKEYNTTHIPEMVGEFNKESNFSEKLEVVMVLSCQKCDIQNYTEGDFDQFLSSAMRANNEFQGTVQTLLVNYDRLNGTSNNILAELPVLSNLTNFGQNQNFTFGLLLQMEHCGRTRGIESLSPDLKKIVLLVNTLVFALAPAAHDLELGVEQSLGGYFRWFNFCREKIRIVNPNVEIGYMVEWSQTAAQDVEELVRFWGEMKKWARDTNTTIFINEAFDVPHRGNNTLSSRGWWRLASSKGARNNHLEFEFEDKKTVLERQLNGPSQPTSTSEKPGGVDPAVIIAPTGVGLFGLFGLSGFFIYVKIVRKQRSLSKEEIRDFFEGDGKSLVLDGGENQHTMAYNTELECSTEEFLIDEENILGAGEFGIVFLAKLQRNEFIELKVATKTTKSPSSNIALKMILSEIRILGYLGQHANIVSIVGAYTAELGEGKVFAFTEFCSLGCLKDFLKNMITRVCKSSSFSTETSTEPMPEDGEGGYVDLEVVEDSDGDEMSLFSDQISEMMKWSREICSGMEYLVSKHVVHADLATRNVLLTERKVAKITDFGLSRRLYGYQSYIKRQKEALPWRWMAPESLKQLEFNEKTDVWAFGVTLWEIFSCGNIPYAGLVWDPYFLNALENGFKLQRPQYDHANLYAVMLKCWNLDPKLRPTFLEMQSQFERMQADNNNFNVTWKLTTTEQDDDGQECMRLPRIKVPLSLTKRTSQI